MNFVWIILNLYNICIHIMSKGNICRDAQYVVVFCKRNCFVVELCVNVNVYEKEIGLWWFVTKQTCLLICKY